MSRADAVYLGLKNFNARARAENFSLKDLEELVPLAHHFGMQVGVIIYTSPLQLHSTLGSVVLPASRYRPLLVSLHLITSTACLEGGRG